MSSEPKISVIIPVYNVEKYLAKCLDSVFAQDFDSFEVICVDDGSTDSSPEILARCAAEHENMRVVRKENGGLSSARNAGMDVARGKYILFIDSDDQMLGADSVSGMYRRAEETGADFVFFGSEIEYESEDLVPNFKTARTYMRRETKYPDGLSGQRLFGRMVDNGDYYACAVLNLYRREFLTSNHLRFLEGYVFEDQLFMIQCMTLARNIAQYARSCYLYFVRSKSIMTGMALAENARNHYRIAAKIAAFYRERFRLAPPPEGNFKRYYFRWVRTLTGLGAKSLRQLPRPEQRALLDALAPDELQLARRSIARSYYLPVVRFLPRQLRRVRRRLKRWIKGESA